MPWNLDAISSAVIAPFLPLFLLILSGPRAIHRK